MDEQENQEKRFPVELTLKQMQRLEALVDMAIETLWFGGDDELDELSAHLSNTRDSIIRSICPKCGEPAVYFDEDIQLFAGQKHFEGAYICAKCGHMP